jgi:hypothetical protein
MHTHRASRRAKKQNHSGPDPPLLANRQKSRTYQSAYSDTKLCSHLARLGKVACGRSGNPGAQHLISAYRGHVAAGVGVWQKQKAWSVARGLVWSI